MKYIGYHDVGTLPIKRLERIKIPAGVQVRSTNPARRTYVTKRAQWITVKSLGCGQEADEQEYQRYHASRVPNAPVIETPWGPRRAVWNPSVMWSGNGSYWCEVDINDILCHLYKEVENE